MGIDTMGRAFGASGRGRDTTVFPRARREIPVIIRKNGGRLIPSFPIELNSGDQLIIAKEMMGSEVPEGQKWLVKGYNDHGPIKERI